MTAFLKAVLFIHKKNMENNMKVAMTGVSGNMGREALIQALELDFICFVRVLITPKKRTINW